MINALESPVIKIDSLQTKFDTVVVSNSLIALLDYNFDEARFLQQLHYWSYSKYGVVIDGVRWIHKSVQEWITEALAGFTEWKLRKAIASLLEKKLIKREKLFVRHQKQEYRSFWWQPKNQTYYYSIDYEELQKLIKKAESTGNVRFENSTKLSSEESKDTKVCELSQINTDITNNRKSTTKQESDRLSNKSEPLAAAELKSALEGKERHQSNNPYSADVTASTGQKKVKSEATQSNPTEEKSSTEVDYIINKNYKSLIPLLDGVGVAVNKTIRDLLKMYPAEKVEGAIALLKARKREQHVSNLSGYFVAALKGDWTSQSLAVEETGDRETEEVDKGAVFRHWYDLAKQLGVCSGQKVEDGEQFVCLSGTWEKWDDAVKRGYSLAYLKTKIKN